MAHALHQHDHLPPVGRLPVEDLSWRFSPARPRGLGGDVRQRDQADRRRDRVLHRTLHHLPRPGRRRRRGDERWRDHQHDRVLPLLAHRHYGHDQVCTHRQLRRGVQRLGYPGPHRQDRVAQLHPCPDHRVDRPRRCGHDIHHCHGHRLVHPCADPARRMAPCLHPARRRRSPHRPLHRRL